MRKGRYYIPMILITPQDRMKKVTNNCLCIFQPSRCGVVAVTDLHEDNSKQHLQGLGVAGAKMVVWQGRGIALNRALSYMSHNKDFATCSLYDRQGSAKSSHSGSPSWFAENGLRENPTLPNVGYTGASPIAWRGAIRDATSPHGFGHTLAVPIALLHPPCLFCQPHRHPA
jgi:hypothetical protein